MPEIKHRSAGPPGRQIAQTQAGWRQGSDGGLWHRRRDCVLFCGCLRRVVGVNSSLWEKRVWAPPHLSCPSARMEFREQHSTTQRSLEPFTPSHALLHPAGTSPLVQVYPAFREQAGLPEDQHNSLSTPSLPNAESCKTSALKKNKKKKKGRKKNKKLQL